MSAAALTNADKLGMIEKLKVVEQEALLRREQLEAEIALSKVDYPRVLTDALGDLVGQATVVTTAKLRKILTPFAEWPVGFLGHHGEHPSEMPSPFIRAKEGVGDISGFVVRIAPVNKPTQTKLVMIFQRWREICSLWNATAPKNLLPESTTLEKAHFEKFALLAKGSKVKDEDGVEWQRV